MFKLNLPYVRELMLKLDLPIIKIAKQAGLSRTTVAKIFEGQRAVHIQTLRKLAECFQVDARTLILDESD